VPWPAAAATGACALAAADAAAGWAGLLSGDRSRFWSLALLVPGVVALVHEVRHTLRAAPAHDAPSAGERGSGACVAPWWFPISLGLAIPALVVAAASEPGVLWSTEFGAYDALSYHLALPQEWHAGHGIATLGHCAYSGLPSWTEAAYLHIRALGGGRAWGGSSWFVSAQMLHAALAAVAGLCTGEAARRMAAGAGSPARTTASAVACVLVLGLPWLAVTGTLAYSESLMLCALAAAMCVLAEAIDRQALVRGNMAALTCLGVAACGAKLSAALLVALPLAAAALTLWRGRSARARVADALLCVALALTLLAPWWVRNMIATGNPLFPFAEPLLGAGAWTAEQSARFASAHAPPSGGQAIAALWHQWIAFGWGAPPPGGGAWRPLWSLMPILVICATAWGVVDAWRTRALRSAQGLCAIMILAQAIAWMACTHGQSRFLLPSAVPGSVLVACAIVHVRPLLYSRLLAVAMLAWSAQPALAFLRDGPDPRAAALWIGAAEDLAGVPAAGAGAAGSGAGSGPAGTAVAVHSNLVQAINGLDPGSARVASVGFAATARVRPDVALDWCSVWDRGAVAQALVATGGDGDAAARMLAAEGWTHLAIDRVMLDVWARAGWLDPVLDPQALGAMCEGRRVAWTGPQGALVTLSPDAERPWDR
jgi:hypothetical protein